MRKLGIVGAENQHSQLVSPSSARKLYVSFRLTSPNRISTHNLSMILKTFISESNFKTIRICN